MHLTTIAEKVLDFHQIFAMEQVNQAQILPLSPFSQKLLMKILIK